MDQFDAQAVMALRIAQEAETRSAAWPPEPAPEPATDSTGDENDPA